MTGQRRPAPSNGRARKTADHTVDAVSTVAFFLASRRQDNYPTWVWARWEPALGLGRSSRRPKQPAASCRASSP